MARTGAGRDKDRCTERCEEEGMARISVRRRSVENGKDIGREGQG